jgi:DNA-binding beta-propeller fold protein YncE
MRLFRYAAGFLVFAITLSTAQSTRPAPGTQHYLYVASPGIGNHVEYGGVGILVFDIDHGYKFVKRIPTWKVPDALGGLLLYFKKPEDVRGIAASAQTGRVYVTSLNHMIAIDAVTGRTIWDKTCEGGCDRLAISPDGKTLYVPELRGPAWHVVDAATGAVIATIETKSGSHNTIYAADGSNVYLAGIHSPVLSIADPKTKTVTATVGPFADFIRPFTVNGANSLVYVNVNNLLGFEIGDIKTGKKLYHVEVQGYEKGDVKRVNYADRLSHDCPAHGIALTHDEKELWLADCHNSAIHIFDNTVMPPKQTTSLKMRDCVGWISMSLDGRYAYSSTGEVIDVNTKKIVAALTDEVGRQVQSEKVLDVYIADGKVTRVGDQFGVGMEK